MAYKFFLVLFLFHLRFKESLANKILLLHLRILFADYLYLVSLLSDLLTYVAVVKAYARD